MTDAHRKEERNSHKPDDSANAKTPDSRVVHAPSRLMEVKATPLGPPWILAPVSVTFDLTQECNLRCTTCIEAQPMRRCGPSRTFSTASALRLMEQLASLGVTELLLYGGEPLLHPGVFEVLRSAATLFGKLRIVTNATLLKHRPGLANAILDAARKTRVLMRASLNAGFEDTHSLLHGRKGFFQKKVDGIGYLAEQQRVTGVFLSDLEVSYLVQPRNVGEIVAGYEVVRQAGDGITAFSIRGATGPNGISVLPLNSRERETVRVAVAQLEEASKNGGPAIRIESWFKEYLDTGAPPTTNKAYPSCYYCAACRLIITPPEPGLVWACTYWRQDPRFLVADLAVTPLGSPEFEKQRIAAIHRINPAVDCAGVICNRASANEWIWSQQPTSAPVTAKVEVSHAV